MALAVTAGGLPAALRFRAIAGPSRFARNALIAGLVAGALWLVLPGGGGLFTVREGAWTLAHLPGLALIGVTLLAAVAIVVTGAATGYGAWAALVAAWAGFAVLAQHASTAGDVLSWPLWTLAVASSTLAALCAFSGAALLGVARRSL
ncbi:MAG: hypothetical protein WCJ30_22735 [Deltaproteobacteria bacterium]